MVDTENICEKKPETMDVQVCHASTQKTTMIALTLKGDSTIREVIKMSQILVQHPEIDIEACKVGIFGKLKTLNTVVRQGDRVEIYRSLTADPMEARRRRSAKQQRIKSIL
ncbi:MAG: RnfH family protein [Pseudomonadota bacterium]